MNKNLKNSVLFILIAMTLLLIVIMSLAASKPVSINTATVSAQKENKLKYGKWSGLGMMICSTDDNKEFDSYVDTLLANGFTEIRTEIPNWNYEPFLTRSKAAVVRSVDKGMKVIWGVEQWADGRDCPYITANNWPNFRQAILDNAQWAQDNGVYEFQVGNEEECHVDGITMTADQIIINLKSVAKDVQSIFTNGKVSYSCDLSHVSNWVSAGKGDLDIVALNAYMGRIDDFDDYWKTQVAALVNTFGSSGTYITEFAPSSTSLDSYSTDETVQAEAVNEMLEYIKASGINRANYFLYAGHKLNDSLTSNYGVLKDDGTYRLIWNALISSNTLLD